LDLDQSLQNIDPSLEKPQTRRTEASELAPAKSTVGPEEHKRSVTGMDRFGQESDLISGQIALLLTGR
jgi:hypothetical protein